MKRAPLALTFAAAIAAGCSDPQAPSPSDASVDRSASDASMDTSAADALDDRPTVDAFVCDEGCGPGALCVRGACVEDCRVAGANPCAAPTVCDMLTGRCLDPASACTVPGETVRCGATEFPSLCGPGTVCDMPTGRCNPSSDCARVVCDAAGNCRGVECRSASAMTSVRGLSLTSATAAPAGTPMGIRVRAHVDATSVCGLNVTVELRRDEGLFTSAGNDQSIWHFTLDGRRTRVLGSLGNVSGLAADRTGRLYYMLTRTGEVRRIVDPGGGMPVTSELYANTGAPGSGRGVARITFGPDGLLYAANRTRIQRVERSGMVTTVTTVTGLFQDTITGLTFDAEGALVFSEIFPRVFRLAPGAMAPAVWYTINAIVPGSRTVTDFFHEALALGPDGLVYGTSFPSNPVSGLLYQRRADGTLAVIADRTSIQATVPTTRWAGIHGMAFGACGDIYFVNQNTQGNTREPLGQLLVRRASTGAISLLNEGFNLEWPDGFDGDLVVAQVAFDRATATVNGSGDAEVTFHSPTTPGCYQVRVLLTDPMTGAIREARGSVTVP
ncbi:MAG: hypothetical protein JNK05_01950 [Myxococcales bacterium]|nr:hypothetical protein [Myxococcales bacterium]